MFRPSCFLGPGPLRKMWSEMVRNFNSPSLRRWVFGVCVVGGLLPGSLFMGGHRRGRPARMDTPLLRGRRCIEMGHNHLAAGLRRNTCRRGSAIFAPVFLVILLISHLGT